MGQAHVLALLADRAKAAEIMASIEAISQKDFGAAGELRPGEGFAVSPAFDPGSDVSHGMRHAYETIMPALYFGADPLPTWADICMRVQEHAELL